MKGLQSLERVASLPQLHTLGLIRTVAIADEDLEKLARHPTLAEFEWVAEDVPEKVCKPVQERMSHLRRPRWLRAEEWFAERLQAG
jgi:hypothetical protein